MKELKFLEVFTGTSVDDLVKLERTHRVDSLVLAMEAALDRRAQEEGLSSLTTEERVVLAVEALEREVNNGGYDQLLRNDSHIYSGEIEGALRAIGCMKHADIARAAIAALKIDGRPSAKRIDAALEKGGTRLEAKLEACDKAYFAQTEDIAGCLFAFAKANKSKIKLA